METCTILTTTANDRVRPCHDRMPVLVAPPDFATWLDAARPPAEVERLFAPAPAASLTATPVCGWVNDVRHEGPRCVEGQRCLRATIYSQRRGDHGELRDSSRRFRIFTQCSLSGSLLKPSLQ